MFSPSRRRAIKAPPLRARWRAPLRNDLDYLLATNAARPVRERLTLTRIFEELWALGYDGNYDAVRWSAAVWRRCQSEATAAAFMPVSFAPGEAYQFDSR